MTPVMSYKYKKKDSIEFMLKARTIRRMAKLVERYCFEVIEKKDILFPIALFAPYVVVFARKEEK